MKYILLLVILNLSAFAQDQYTLKVANKYSTLSSIKVNDVEYGMVYVIENPMIDISDVVNKDPSTKTFKVEIIVSGNPNSGKTCAVLEILKNDKLHLQNIFNVIPFTSLTDEPRYQTKFIVDK